MAPRIAIVGAGRWSSRVHLPACRELQNRGLAEYVGVCDLDADKAHDYASVLDTRPFSDLDRMIEAVGPDGIVLLVGHADMAAAVQKAIDLRVPFLCEKPPAPDLATHRELLKAAHDLPHVVAYNRRHAPYVAKAKEWLADETLQVVAVHFARHRRRAEDFTTTTVHAIDAALFLAGDLVAARIEAAPTGHVTNFFVDGWTAAGTRVTVLVTPDTGSAEEHYVCRSTDRTVRVAFPQEPIIDRPGRVELHEGNEVVKRLRPEDFGLADTDLPALIGILGEQERFARMLAGEADSLSTLRTSLGTQVLREELRRLIGHGRRSVDWRAQSDADG
jgi:predicted dehydrogenase